MNNYTNRKEYIEKLLAYKDKDLISGYNSISRFVLVENKPVQKSKLRADLQYKSPDNNNYYQGFFNPNKME